MIEFSPQGIANIAPALAVARLAFGKPEKNQTAKVTPRDGKAGFTFDYADRSSYLDAVDAALAKQGITLWQPAESRYEDRETVVRIQTWLIHSSGEWMRSPVMEFWSPPAMKEVGGAITYAGRYQLRSFLAIDGDSDDNAGEGETVPVRRAPAPGEGRFVCSHGQRHPDAASARACKGHALHPDAPVVEPEPTPPPEADQDDTLEPGVDPVSMKQTPPLPAGAARPTLEQIARGAPAAPADPYLELRNLIRTDRRQALAKITQLPSGPAKDELMLAYRASRTQEIRS